MMQDFVICLLKEQIPANYSYHNYEHTLYVQTKARELGIQEGLNKHEIELLDAAALWHDTGYVHTYKGHEEESCVMARQYLPDFGFAREDIEIICGMIMATKIPQTASTLMQQIIADADLAYLGTLGAFEKADDLYKEIKSIDTNLTKEEWNRQQVNFLTSHRYFTRYYQEKKEPIKQAYLGQIRDLMQDK